MSACECVTRIAYSLEAQTDRLALFQTSPDPKKLQSSGNLLPLELLNLGRLRKVLDDLEVRAGLPDPDCLASMITQAQSHLTSRSKASPTDNQGRRAIRQIIVVTPRLHTVVSNSSSEDRIGVHVICPGILPWQSQEPVKGDGWHVDHQPSSGGLSAAGNVRWEEHMSDRIHALMPLLRSHSIPRTISDLQVTIKPGCYSTIEGIRGVDVFQSLRAGEILKSFVKVRVSTTRKDSSDVSSISEDVSSGSEDVSTFSEDMSTVLDGTLQEKLISILSVKIRYTHSDFPVGMMREIITCRKIRVISSFHQKQNQNAIQNSASRIGDFNLETALMQKCFIYYFATNDTPYRAAISLCDRFGEGLSSSICPRYMARVIAELKHQYHAAARIDSFDTENFDDTSEGRVFQRSNLSSSISMRATEQPTNWRHSDIDIPMEEDQHAINEPAKTISQVSDNEMRQTRSGLRKISIGNLFSMMGRKGAGRSTRMTEAQKQSQALAVINERIIGPGKLESMVFRRRK